MATKKKPGVRGPYRHSSDFLGGQMRKAKARKKAQHEKAWLPRNRPRIKILARMRQRGASGAEIGLALGGLCKQRIGEILKRAERLLGKEMFEPKEPMVTLREAAARFGVRASWIRYLCKKDKIPHERCGRRYRLTKESMDFLQECLEE